MAHSRFENASLRSLSHGETWSNGHIGSRDTKLGTWNDGDPRIARALHWAQRLPNGDGAQLARLRTLDELIALARRGRGWGRVFKELKAEGLIQEQTLGHVVARWTGRRHSLRPAAGPAAGPAPGAVLRAAPMPSPIRSA